MKRIIFTVKCLVLPLIYTKILETGTTIGIWKQDEPLRWYQQRLELGPAEASETTGLSRRKKMEWMSSRWLIHHLTKRKDRIKCLKDSFGKPHLDAEGLEVSLSHSGAVAAAILSPLNCGIDIQKFVAKITRIAPRFMSPDELSFADRQANPLALYHLFWSAKEAMYKAYGRKEMDFKKHMSIPDFQYIEGGGRCIGRIEINGLKLNFDLHYEHVGNFTLVYAIQKT